MLTLTPCVQCVSYQQPGVMTAIASLLARDADPHLLRHKDSAQLSMFTAATAITGGPPRKRAPPDVDLCTSCEKGHTQGLEIHSLRHRTHRCMQTVQVSIMSVIFAAIHPTFHSLFPVNKHENTDMHFPHNSFRYTYPVASLCCVSLFLSCVGAAICKYADVVTLALHTPYPEHSVG